MELSDTLFAEPVITGEARIKVLRIMTNFWKWERREQRENKKKNSMKMHGKGMKRVENDLEHRPKVEPGMMFVDEKRNRELTVVQKTESGIWLCKSQFTNTTTLYGYDEEFILKHRTFKL